MQIERLKSAIESESALDYSALASVLLEVRHPHHFLEARLFLLRQPDALLQQRLAAGAAVAIADFVGARRRRQSARASRDRPTITS